MKLLEVGIQFLVLDVKLFDFVGAIFSTILWHENENLSNFQCRLMKS